MQNVTFVSDKVSQIPSEFTQKPCTAVCRSFVSVSHLNESWPLLDKFAVCEILRKCFLICLEDPRYIKRR